MRILHYIIIGAATLLLTSCGEQSSAESIVSDFMDENLVDPSALSEVSFSDIDSTKYLNDSVIGSLRSQIATTSKVYKKDIAYGEMSRSGKLFLVRVNYKIDDDAHQSTFYINDDFSAIVAFKTN